MALPAQAVPNTVVGNYRILERIASGGMGVVYKAFDLSLQRTVALKFVSPDRTSGAAERDRLLREARAASVLDHENIAAIHHIGETEDGQLFIDMGYYEGEDLATRMCRRPLTTGQSLDIVCQVARGLAHAHAHGVIHRDIKPANIIVTSNGVAKIVDFGLARFVSPDASTLSMSFAGTLRYMSPEQLNGKSLDARTDVWSLGVILYELLVGRHPFIGDSTAALLNSILNLPPEDFDRVPEEFKPILNRALQKDTEGRYRSCIEFLRDLEPFAGKPTPETLHLPLRRTSWGILRWVVAVAAILVALMIHPPSVNIDRKETNDLNFAPDQIYEQGLKLLERYDKPDNLKEAIQKFEQTAKSDPNFALAYAALGEAYVDKYRQDLNPDFLKRAEEYCQTAVRLNNQLAEVYVTLGRVHILSGKQDLGQQEILRALKMDPRSVKGLLALGDAYARASRISDAEKAYTRATALDPENWDSYLRLGGFYFGIKQFQRAADQYRRVIALAPDNATAHSNLSAALFNLGDMAEAEKEMKEAIRLAPTYTAYYNFAWRYYTQQRYPEAAAMAELASELNPDDYKVWQMLGLCYEWTNQFDKARAAYQHELLALQKSARLKSNDAVAQAELGLLYSKLQRREEASRYLQTALALEPDSPDVLALVGEAYENLSDREQALSNFESAAKNGWDLKMMYNNPDLRQFVKDPKVQARLQQAARERAKRRTHVDQ
jgi:serine/threonine protein kinase/Flp pilus assembly protein TadD